MTDLPEAAEITTALSDELDANRRLLPAFSHYAALRVRVPEVSYWIHGYLGPMWQPSLEQVVAASKARHGVRPIAVWDLQSATVYRTLANRLKPYLPAPVRSGTAWTTFLRAPLEKEGTYIVSADIAACYQFIDHALLAEELIEHSGDGPTVVQIVELLRGVQGRRYGLPQQSAPSDLLAETYLSALERRITRKSVDVIRYNDDFRVNCTSWSDVVRTIELLSEEARSMGLLLNDSKVLTYRRATYANRLDRVEALRAEIADEAELDLTDFMESYDGVDVIEPEQADVDRLTAVRVLERWQRTAGRGTVRENKRSEHAALLQLVPLALHELSRTKDDAPNAIEISMNLLRYEQTATPAVCAFLLTRKDDDALLAAFDKLLKRNVYLTGWQAWWLQQPLARLNLTTGTGSKRRKEWLQSLFAAAHRSPVLRANAAKTLARHGLVTANELLRVYDRSTPVERPIVVEAMALTKPPKAIEKAVTGDSKLHEWVYMWTAQHV